ncbi:MAG: phosphatidylglycerophosphatase A [Gammaproteobacteria bacterium]|nr:phosphatidylglycerophosphatase A [Gammaproteobacteria bacterium]
MRDPIHWLAVGFGSGCSPYAPGTFGTLVAIPIFLLLKETPLWVYLFITLLMFLIGIWLCGKTAKKLGVHDHSAIVWDEIVGYLVTMIAAPQGWVWIVIGFVLFRVFDILKPWPISIADKRISGGFGIMIDDVLAGIAAFVVLHGFYYSIVLWQK